MFAVPQHGSLSLYTKLQSPLNCKICMPIHTVWHLDDFQAPLDFHSHDSWFVCKAVLRFAFCYVQNAREVMYNFGCWIYLEVTVPHPITNCK